MKKPTIQELLKKHLKDYKPTYEGLTYDGISVSPKIKGIGLKEVSNFLKDVDLHYDFKINKNSIFEELETDEDTYLFFVRDLTRKGFYMYLD